MTSLAIFGAGSVGCYLGGCLASAGTDALLIGRERIGRELAQHGLLLTDLEGRQRRVSPDAIRFAVDPAAAAAADLVLVTVKSAATEDVGRTLAPLLRPGTVVISFQNGIGNAAQLRQLLPACTVLAGMVPFNVVHRAAGQFHRGSAGALEVERHAALAPYRARFAAAGLPLQERVDMQAVLWAKLLLNLNNAINALSGLPLKQQLAQRDFRRCLALAQREALQLLDAAGIRLARLTPLPPHWLPPLLTVPDRLFRLLAPRMLAIDPLARSSMWEDLEAGRRTEIDWISGELLALAVQQGRTAPVNARLVELVRAAESGTRRDWSGSELLATLKRALGE